MEEKPKYMSLMQWIRGASTNARSKRFALFNGLVKRKIASTPNCLLRLLDVGGTESYWHQVGYVGEGILDITILNLDSFSPTIPSIKSVVCDARSLCFGDREFDIVFSNSLIEHVGGLDDQRRVADEIRRVGLAYWVQTPNYYFPIEPHSLVPLLQFFPRQAKPYLVRYFTPKERQNVAGFKKEILDIQMLTRRRVGLLFPEAQIWEEGAVGLTKSFVALRGWE